MHFASDNSAPVHPLVMQALTRANDGSAMGYGNDDLSAQVVQQVRDLFEAPEAAVYLVPTGTSANALALSILCQPYQTVFCSELAHINVDECNAPEFYTGGAKLTLVRVPDVMTPDSLRAALDGEENRGVHGPLRGPVSITNVTEMGNVYSLREMTELCAVAKDYGLPVHLDGARFAQACVAMGCTPAEMTWQIGVDVAVFGGTKNGLMGVEAVVIFDPAKAQEFEYRRKRAGHLFSKHRYLAAQMEPYLTDDLWRELAISANTRAAELRAGLEALGLEIVNDTQANMIFFRMPLRAHYAAKQAGAAYHLMEPENVPEDTPVMARLVCSWDTPSETVQALLHTFRNAL
ncbi:threonine aldolase family protein [Tropicibacter naphthalenivorans]|uniref:Low specificity L-threonine aldolase n=1 Tax=Tropicibacter naphthalenivorans TaxID=441103 RepID=A0A0P1GA56_9RHOB|nr:low specificity L-threonine aldolase [Tropicibacter naphthalenivorans]CUH78301.1 Low specificity L-threonine aldolase [Tropicibacter naphthalenivorans]SMC79165.1 L-threonine aldolase [Tropicibacter naphthalenivorans]